MAKRRDAMTRAVRSYERSEGVKLPTRFTTEGNDRRDAPNRNKGRRGVRARARLNRIVERQKNDTYTPKGGISRFAQIVNGNAQPEGGNGSNS